MYVLEIIQIRSSRGITCRYLLHCHNIRLPACLLIHGAAFYAGETAIAFSGATLLYMGNWLCKWKTPPLEMMLTIGTFINRKSSGQHR